MLSDATKAYNQGILDNTKLSFIALTPGYVEDNEAYSIFIGIDPPRSLKEVKATFQRFMVENDYADRIDPEDRLMNGFLFEELFTECDSGEAYENLLNIQNEGIYIGQFGHVLELMKINNLSQLNNILSIPQLGELFFLWTEPWELEGTLYTLNSSYSVVVAQSREDVPWIESLEDNLCSSIDEDCEGSQ